jgi:hypothetical protein
MSATDKRRTCADCGADVPYGHYHTVLECIEKLKAVTAELESRLAGHPASEPPKDKRSVYLTTTNGCAYSAYFDHGNFEMWRSSTTDKFIPGTPERWWELPTKK